MGRLRLPWVKQQGRWGREENWGTPASWKAVSGPQSVAHATPSGFFFKGVSEELGRKFPNLFVVRILVIFFCFKLGGEFTNIHGITMP